MVYQLVSEITLYIDFCKAAAVFIFILDGIYFKKLYLQPVRYEMLDMNCEMAFVSNLKSLKSPDGEIGKRCGLRSR
jgi:hypothetical protein